jgi:integrase
MLSKKHFETGLEFKQISNISINQKKTNSFIDSLVEINALPFKNKTIYFTDNKWDLSSFTILNIQRKNLRFNFTRVQTYYQDELKKFVLVKILENKAKLTSINRIFNELALYFNFLYSNNIFNIKEVNFKNLKEFLSSRENISMSALKHSKSSLKNFYNYYAANYENILTEKMEEILKPLDTRIMKAIQNQNKTPDIPNNYFDSLIKSILKIFDDPDELMHIKATGCIIMILSQTGLRISEVLALEIDALKSINIDNNETNYLLYKTWKRERGENKYSIEKTYVNQLTKKAFLLLLNLHRERRKKINISYLYTGNKILHDSDYYPVDSNAFLRYQKEFYINFDKYLPTIDVPINKQASLNTIKITKDYERFLNIIGKKGKTLTYPKNQQYRVHMCTELYNKGVPLKYIQKFMGHLSSDMQDYYIRPKNQIQENIEFSKKTIEDIITGKLTLLGSNSNDFTNKIHEFIEKNKFNVKKDIDTIVDSLIKKIPIRQKSGGVCIKSSVLRECSIDAKTNEFYCAYGVCPNVFHFFYNIDISYRKVKELSKSIKINSKNGFVKQVQKEKNMLFTVILNQFEPEFKELKKEIIKKEIEDIYIEYPNIKYIVENINQIEQEVSKCKKLAIV